MEGKKTNIAWCIITTGLASVSIFFAYRNYKLIKEIKDGQSKTTSKASGEECPCKKEEAFRQTMRKLWADHVIWTRNYIIAYLDKSGNVDEASKRLFKNQEDIGAVIAEYYGKEAGDKFTTLLKQHILIAIPLIKSIEDNNKLNFGYEYKQWKENADAITDFLAKANPNWNIDELKKQMNTHLTLTNNEVFAHKKQEWAKEVQAFDRVFDHSLNGLADTLSNGIIKQFNEKFK